MVEALKLTDLLALVPVVKALVKGGWLGHAGGNWLETVRKVVENWADLSNILTDYQRHFGLNPTGILDSGTLAHLRLRRFCGCPDRQSDVVWNATALPIPDREVRWYFDKADDLHPITKTAVLKAADWTWTTLAGLCGIRVRNVATAAEANAIMGTAAIDGGLGTLAWSELASGRAGAVMHQAYDNGESWIAQHGNLSDTNDDIDLYRVMAHECIHLLGFGHDDTQPCLMNSIYSLTIDRPNPADVARLQKVYGPPLAPVPPTTPPTPGTPPTGPVFPGTVTQAADGVNIFLKGLKLAN